MWDEGLKWRYIGGCQKSTDNQQYASGSQFPPGYNTASQGNSGNHAYYNDFCSDCRPAFSQIFGTGLANQEGQDETYDT
jgi:hypothetical protein